MTMLRDRIERLPLRVKQALGWLLFLVGFYLVGTLAGLPAWVAVLIAAVVAVAMLVWYVRVERRR
jgi:hypothetical protein